MIEENDKLSTSFEIFSVMMDEDSNGGDDSSLEKEEDEEEDISGKVDASFACEDCDYRWDSSIYMSEDGEIDDETFYCPMCGSTNILQI